MYVKKIQEYGSQNQVRRYLVTSSKYEQIEKKKTDNTTLKHGSFLSHKNFLPVSQRVHQNFF